MKRHSIGMMALTGMASVVMASGCGTIGEVFVDAFKEAAVEEIQDTAKNIVGQIAAETVAGLIPTTLPALLNDSNP